MNRVHSTCRAAFSLIEAVVVVIVVAVAVPPSMMWLDEAVTRRVDAANLNRATMLASAVLETVLADSASDAAGLGFAAFATPATYLDGAGAGLRARMSTVFTPYQTVGMSYNVTIGDLVSSSGAANADIAQNVFRKITVEVSYPAAAGGTQVLALSCVVTSP
jgi:type II secretory pathway pseudopilin PulG